MPVKDGVRPDRRPVRLPATGAPGTLPARRGKVPGRPGHPGGLLALSLLAALLAGCSGDGPDGGPTPSLDPCELAGAPAAIVDVSERTDLFHAGPYVRIGAFVRDAPEPSLHEVAAEEGACRHLRAATAFCDPPCGEDEACAPPGTCVAYPRLVSGGTLTLEGLGAAIHVEPEDWSAGTYVGPTGLAAPPFGPDDVVAARFAGDTFPRVSMVARGVASIDATLTTDGLDLVDGDDAEITWTPGPDPDACVEVVLNGFNASHGAPLGDVIVCESPDDGSLAVPRSMVEAFPEGETPEVTESYDWPHSELTRYTRSSAVATPGVATLWVRSTAYFLIRHTR